MLRKLQARYGIRSVRLNAKAGSVTIFYDVDCTDAQQILEFLHGECLRASRIDPARARAAAPVRSGSPLAAEIGRMALGVLVNKGVSLSLASLLGARL
jgi:hypothetical protein